MIFFLLQNYLHQLTKHPFLCTLLDYFLACSHRVNCQHESNKKLCICKNWNSCVQYKMPFHCLTTACAQRRREENMYGSFTNDVNQRFGFIDSPHLQSREYSSRPSLPSILDLTCKRLHWTSLRFLTYESLTEYKAYIFFGWRKTDIKQCCR